MPYLAPDFDPDIFVSYSHGPLVEDRWPLRDWTQALIARLEGRLRSLGTDFKDLRLWIDPKIDPTVNLTDQLKETVSRSGLLIVVISEYYLDSKWCKDERKWFEKEILSRPEQAGRVFILRAQKTDEGLWPEFLRELTGFSFYDPESGFPWDYPDLATPNPEFSKQLLNLHIRLAARLRELRERVLTKAERKAKATALGGQPTKRSVSRLIYLHAPLNSDKERAEIKQALQSDGIVSLTAAESSANSLADWQHEARQLRLEAAKRCEALALLRVRNAGDSFVSDLLDICVDERERIAIARGAQLPCAVLDKTGEPLPVEIPDIERFDVNQSNWRSLFRDWLDGSSHPERKHSLAPATDVLPRPVRPYPGLRPFEEDEWSIFYRCPTMRLFDGVREASRCKGLARH